MDIERCGKWSIISVDTYPLSCRFSHHFTLTPMAWWPHPNNNWSDFPQITKLPPHPPAPHVSFGFFPFINKNRLRTPRFTWLPYFHVNLILLFSFIYLFFFIRYKIIAVGGQHLWVPPTSRILPRRHRCRESRHFIVSSLFRWTRPAPTNGYAGCFSSVFWIWLWKICICLPRSLGEFGNPPPHADKGSAKSNDLWCGDLNWGFW